MLAQFYLSIGFQAFREHQQREVGEIRAQCAIARCQRSDPAEIARLDVVHGYRSAIQPCQQIDQHRVRCAGCDPGCFGDIRGGSNQFPAVYFQKCRNRLMPSVARVKERDERSAVNQQLLHCAARG